MHVDGSGGAEDAGANHAFCHVALLATYEIGESMVSGGDSARRADSVPMDLEPWTLQTIPWDARLDIFAVLPFADFVSLVRVCKDWSVTTELNKLGRKTISEMARAVTGKDILLALRPDNGAAAMLPVWAGALLLCFARKTAQVALHDHQILTAAWLGQFAEIKSKMIDNSTFGIREEIDALQWFAQSPQQRYAHCDGMTIECVSAAEPVVMPALSSSGMTLVLESVLPYHSHSMRTFCMLDQMVRESAQVVFLETYEKNRPERGRTLSLPLLRRYAWEWFVQADLTTSISALLFDKFGVGLDVQRRELDPYIAEKIVGFSSQTGTQIHLHCQRWRRDDAAFIVMVEQYCLRHIPLDVLRGAGGAECDAGIEPGIRIRLWQYETENEGIFRGDADLAAQFNGIYTAIRAARDFAAWHALLNASVQMPWYVAPLLMQHLACRLCVLARVAGQRLEIETGLPALFAYFIAWRDRVVPLCLADGAFDMAARAYAAPVSVTCEPWLDRGGCRDTIGLTRHVNALMDAAQAGLSTLSPRYWHEILETLLSRSLPLPCALRQSEWMSQFLRSPLATARYPSAEFALRVIAQAARIWVTVPDVALGTRTRFTDFCERFDLVGGQCEQLRTAIVDDIGTRVLAKVYRLDDALRDAGFHGDSEMARFMEHKIWHRALRVITRDPDLALAQFVRDTRGAAFLRDQAEIFLAGTTGTVTFDPAM